MAKGTEIDFEQYVIYNENSFLTPDIEEVLISNINLEDTPAETKRSLQGFLDDSRSFRHKIYLFPNGRKVSVVHSNLFHIPPEYSEIALFSLDGEIEIIKNAKDEEQECEILREFYDLPTQDAGTGKGE